VKLAAALRRDVEALATRIGERNVAHPRAYAQAAGFIEQSLRNASYGTARQTFEVEGVDCANVEATLAGGAKSEEIVIIGAHYDSVIGSPGADDNGSGVAAMLALARAFAKQKPSRTLRFVAFANEEPPYFQSAAMGSWRYAKRCRERKENVVAMLSLESIGYFSDEKESQEYPLADHAYPSIGNFIAFASNLQSETLLDRTLAVFRRHSAVPAEGGALPDEVPGVAWSDQWSFWQFGYSAVMLTDTAPFRNPHYHRGTDRPNTLDYERLAGVVEGLVQVVSDLVTA
jgi:Zn-dependent M28 family amino/carboxypeptidase